MTFSTSLEGLDERLCMNVRLQGNTAEISDIDLRTYPRAYLFKSSQLLYAVI